MREENRYLRKELKKIKRSVTSMAEESSYSRENFTSNRKDSNKETQRTSVKESSHDDSRTNTRYLLQPKTVEPSEEEL